MAFEKKGSPEINRDIVSGSGMNTAGESSVMLIRVSCSLCLNFMQPHGEGEK